MPSPVLLPPHAVALRRAAVLSVVVAVASLLATTAVWFAVARESPREVAETRGPAHVEVLRAWDRRRARAWAEGDHAVLRRLYVAGSATGRKDVRMLRRYRDRGLRVEGLQTQLVSVDVVEQKDDRLVLDVVDRVAAAFVVGDGVRRALPEDRPTRRRVEVVRRAGEWLVAEVVDAPSGS
ncbi:hypothetical protein [Nocardioides solisilvae]|uniref:hypothetical protein n=1 Tax=Nocardioides solisilvae TaxID=1542435 RepID=UPI000D746278|nr:hypothetical protein [Nocardioides solisilvae]